MVNQLKKVLTIAFLIHVIGGFIIVGALVFAPPMVIGEGKFDDFVSGFESFNFKWWIVALATPIWLIPIGLVITWQRVKAAGLEIDQLRDKVRTLLEDRFIPVQVDIDERIPVVFDTELEVPVALTTKVDIDSDMEIEARIPIRTELKLDTMIQTKVLGLGKISVPIRGTVPLDFIVPIEGKLRIKASDIPIDIDEMARVEMPPIDIPLTCRIETHIDLLSNLENAGIQKREAED